MSADRVLVSDNFLSVVKASLDGFILPLAVRVSHFGRLSSRGDGEFPRFGAALP
jgi:hypothetical protein